MGDILLVSPAMPNTVKSTLTINSCGANYRRQGLCFAFNKYNMDQI